MRSTGQKSDRRVHHLQKRLRELNGLTCLFLKGEIRDIKFLCLSGTVFDQETRVCERLDEVDCSESTKFYDLNLELYGRHGLIL